MRRNIGHLRQLQSLPLSHKIILTQARIRDWYTHCRGNVYISFSGGKDSTVLLDIARRMYPDIPAVFIDTGLEYPEIREFVKTKENITWVKPKKSFREVILNNGYPVVSKEVSKAVREARLNYNYRLLQFNGQSPVMNLQKYKYLIDSPFKISEQCCNVLKKNPAKEYERQSGNFPITATMASESRLRSLAWITNGCNAYNASRKISNPMSFWTEQDVLEYLYTKNLAISSIYGNVVKEIVTPDLFGQDEVTYKTTGMARTGCMFCMFGVSFDKTPNRFQRMKVTHPKLYDYCFKPVEHGGLGLGCVLDFMGVKYD